MKLKKKMLLQTGEEEESRFVMFADSYGINISRMANFELPMGCPLACNVPENVGKIPENLPVDSWELVLIYSSTQRSQRDVGRARGVPTTHAQVTQLLRGHR